MEGVVFVDAVYGFIISLRNGSRKHGNSSGKERARRSEGG